MAAKKKIPCRVCGKLYEPCAYCQANNETFRWRNFACSKDCATKYINDTIVYRALKHSNLVSPVINENKEVELAETSLTQDLEDQNISAKRRVSKKKIVEDTNIKIENKETE